MQKVLIVGLGGSGGKTLAFLMDELKVRLGHEWGGKLPACWNFVHIDVPVVADGLGSNLATPVAAQGGSYIGLAKPGVNYEMYDTTAINALENQNPPALEMAARWRPQPDKARGIAVAGGAGAYRAVGRVVTVASASGIYAALKTAVDSLASNEANTDLAKLDKQLGASSGGGVNAPLVFIVSSLAGGSGASMVLDVSDILRGLTNGNTFSGEDIQAFLYTADVFQSIKIDSGGPGSLATISELISSTNRLDEPWTDMEWGSLGISGAATPNPSITGRGPSVIFPVGAKSQGIPFGSTPEDVYRGFSRTLAPLFMDSNIQTSFYAYFVVNWKSKISGAGDATGLAKDPITKDMNRSHFSGWGSSVLTMGRDRYTEYAAQRIAREAVEVLVNGFQDQDFLDKKINLQQAIQRGVDAMYLTFLDVAKMQYASQEKSVDFKGMLDSVYPVGKRREFGNSKAMEVANAFSGRGGEATANQLKNYFTSQREALKNSAIADGLNWISTWAVDAQRNVEDAFLLIAAQKGLRVASESVKKLSIDLGALQLDLETKLISAKSNLDLAVQEGLKAINAMGSKPVTAGSPIANKFLENFSSELQKLAGLEAARSLSPVITDFNKNFLSVLIEASNRVLEGLDNELRKKVKTVVTAAYREAPVCLWPTGDGTVPPHFQPAVNEILIDGVAKFPTFFDAHVAQAVAPVASEQVREAARQIIAKTKATKSADGNFEPVVGWGWKRTALDSHPTVDRSKAWQPKELASVTGRPQSQAQFNLHLNWEDVLGFARNWVDLPSCPFRQHGDQGINTWLNPPEGLSAQEASDRQATFDQKFRQAINSASPLVEIDDAMVQTLHGASNIGSVYEFSAVPFAASYPVIDQIINGWSATSQGPVNATNLKKVCDPSSDKSEIFIYGTTGSPYLPIAFASLTKPIRDEWADAVSNNTTHGFWEWRRARSLRQYLPISKRHIAAFMQGWVVGRISGQIQLADSSDGTNSKVVRVLDPRDNSWCEFPKNLLGVETLGIAREATGANESGWNVPPALLESLPLAMAQCQGTDLRPIKPYMAVIELGLSLKIAPSNQQAPINQQEPVGGPANILNPLDVWFNNGNVSEFQSQISSAQGATPEERKNNAIAWLNQVIDKMQGLLNVGVNRNNFWSVNREFELAPEAISAAKTVIRELGRPNLGTAVGGATQVPVNAVGSAVTQHEVTPEVEG